MAAAAFVAGGVDEALRSKQLSQDSHQRLSTRVKEWTIFNRIIQCDHGGDRDLVTCSIRKDCGVTHDIVNVMYHVSKVVSQPSSKVGFKPTGAVGPKYRRWERTFGLDNGVLVDTMAV